MEVVPESHPTRRDPLEHLELYTHIILAFYRRVGGHHIEAFPLDSNGKAKAITPATMNNAPDTKIGALVARLAYSAMIGAWDKTMNTELVHGQQKQAHHDTENTVGAGDDRVACPPPARGEELWRDSIEHAIHDVRREGEGAVPAEQRG